MKTSAPIIGITADSAGHPEERGERAYLLRCNYVDAIFRAGGMAVILPYDVHRAAAYVATIDGLLVTGGHFDIPPGWYGGPAPAQGLVVKEDRSLAERALIEAALAADLPLLGICNGMQLLGVVHGAPVIAHIPDEIAGALQHMAPDRLQEGCHEVRFDPAASLRLVVGTDAAHVNSMHHQALRPAHGMRVAATSSDGVIEAIEIPDRRFCCGVQWHPEYGSTGVDDAIMAAFVAAAAKGARPSAGPTS